MINQNFRADFEIHFHEVNPQEEAAPLTILHFLEDTAIAHSQAVGFGVRQLKEEGLAWILNRWHLQMDHYPKLGETVAIETWPSKFERFYATREFFIRDSKQSVIGRASSLWIFYNILTKRPLRVRPEFQEAYGLNLARAIENPFTSLESSLDGNGKEVAFSVRRSDIDTNGHVNNANYLQWILEAVPDHIYQDCYLSSLEIQYKKETTYGSKIRSCCKCDPAGPLNYLGNHIILGEESGLELALAKTVWESKPK
ncbi:acyl-ACP thioesterase [Desulfosporosinus acididurans]|uniref:Acyl-ACP thioesterase n=1 Tax=Desulfosporosinus acididurans TaxID=476652 RepID=A0A0J1FPJ8_9FIRM|nr:acyl-ACP thioesterase domain-containing protein [Desulfosporosinus acididurans]KLU65415.1 acyl-ACP thioesterase [Desulfosporosinus acididurans]